MARLALALPPGLEAEYAEQAHRHGHEVVARALGIVDAVSLVVAMRPDALIVAADPRYLGARVLTACDDVGVRVVAMTADDAQRQLAASVGLLETTDATTGWPAVEQALGSAPRPTDDRTRTTRGTVIAVWGPTGAPGRTTTAIAVAAELAALGHSVVLADVDTHGASIAPALGMLDEAPGFAAACRLAGNDALSHEELDRIAQRYRSPLGSFRVLTGIGRPSRWPELSGQRVAAVIAQCRTWVDFTVLDVGSSLENDEEISSDMFAPRRNAATLSAVGEADRVIAVGAADPVGLSRFLRAFVDLEDVASGGATTVVMNRVRASAIGMNPHGQVTQTLARFGGIEAPVLVPHDQSAVDGAVLAGRTLADSAPRSAVRLAFKALVEATFAPYG